MMTKRTAPLKPKITPTSDRQRKDCPKKSKPKMNVKRGDGIIIGTSNLHQLSENIKSIKDGPLDKELLDTIDEAWNIAQIECPDYFYYYGK